MKIDYHRHYSGFLGREMEFKHYGHDGQVMIVFPTSGGRFYQFEDFGMIEAIKDRIEAGEIQVFTIDAIDEEGWFSQNPFDHRTQAIANYESYVIHEFVPAVRHLSQRQDGFIISGCSMGGFHAVNFSLKHPDVFHKVLALSGVYDAHYFFSDFYGNETIYLNSPTSYLYQLDDAWFLDKIRHNKYIIAVGQGEYEEECLEDTHKLQKAFKAKSISAWFDYWGHDVSHEWHWWSNQFAYFLPHLL